MGRHGRAGDTAEGDRSCPRLLVFPLLNLPLLTSPQLRAGQLCPSPSREPQTLFAAVTHVCGRPLNMVCGRRPSRPRPELLLLFSGLLAGPRLLAVPSGRCSLHSSPVSLLRQESGQSPEAPSVSRASQRLSRHVSGPLLELSVGPHHPLGTNPPAARARHLPFAPERAALRYPQRAPRPLPLLPFTHLFFFF